MPAVSKTPSALTRWIVGSFSFTWGTVAFPSSATAILTSLRRCIDVLSPRIAAIMYPYIKASKRRANWSSSSMRTSGATSFWSSPTSVSLKDANAYS